ncbi:hypothetical protein CR513_18437, partial [Mucuna pruriens]
MSKMGEHKFFLRLQIDQNDEGSSYIKKNCVQGFNLIPRKVGTANHGLWLKKGYNDVDYVGDKVKKKSTTSVNEETKNKVKINEADISAKQSRLLRTDSVTDLKARADSHLEPDPSRLHKADSTKKQDLNKRSRKVVKLGIHV